MKKLFIFYSLLGNLLIGFDVSIFSIINIDISKDYNIERKSLSLVFLFSAIGCLFATIFSNYFIKKYGLIKILIFSNLFQTLNYILIFVWGKYIKIFYIIYFYIFIDGFLKLYLDIGFNIIISYKSNSTISLNLLSIFYGIGNILGPIITRQIANYNWYYVYLLLFGVSIILLFFIIILDFKFKINFCEIKNKIKSNNNTSTYKIKTYDYIIIIYISLFLMFYFGFSLSLSDWFYTYLLEYLNGNKDIMSIIISIYMIGQVIGRIFIIIIAYFFKNKNLNIISIFIFIIFIWIFLICIYFFKLIILDSILFIFIGFFIGPILPNSISIIKDYFEKSNPEMIVKAISCCTGLSFFGSSFFPFISGLVIEKYKIISLIPICIIFLGLMSLIFIIFIINIKLTLKTNS